MINKFIITNELNNTSVGFQNILIEVILAYDSKIFLWIRILISIKSHEIIS